MSDVARGPGWWLASDGRWYPPETHPSVRTPPTDPGTGAPPGSTAAPGAGAATGGGVVPGSTTVPASTTAPGSSALPGLRAGTVETAARAGRGWGDGRWPDDGTPAAWRTAGAGAGPATTSPSATMTRRAIDQRGVFVAGCSVLLVVACFLPYYRLTPAAGAPITQTSDATVLDALFAGWHLVLPALAVLTLLLGVTNSALRVGSRGAVGILACLRVAALLQLAAWSLAAADRQIQGTGAAAAALGPDPTVALTWVAWAAIAVAVVALAGSLASMTSGPSG